MSETIILTKNHKMFDEYCTIGTIFDLDDVHNETIKRLKDDGVCIDYPPSNHRKRWSEEEENRLKEMHKSVGKGWGDMARELKRTPKACEQKYYDLKEGKLDRVSLQEGIGFQECKGEHQTCSVCGEPMKGDYGLTIRKEIVHGSNSFNVWVHTYCLKRFLNIIEKGIKENEELLMKKKARDLSESIKEG